MKIGVTGGSGFIGSHVVQKLESENFIVFSMGVSTRNDIYLDLSNVQSIINALQECKPDYLVHVASPSVQGIYRSNKERNIQESSELLVSEIRGSYALFKAALSLGVKKIIYISSASVYGSNEKHAPFKENNLAIPDTLYGAIKLSIEEIGRSIVANFISLRLFQVYGEGDISDRLVPTVMSATHGSTLDLTPCEQVSDLIYVKDVASCICELIKCDVNSGTFNLGSGEPVKLKKVVESVLEIMEKGVIPNFEAKNYSGNEVMYSYADMSLLYSKISWRPEYSLYKGIKELEKLKIKNEK